MGRANKRSETLAKSVSQRPERLSLSESRNMLFEKFRTNFRILSGAGVYSDVELAEKIGIESGTYIQQLKYGRKKPEIEDLILIAKFYDVTVDTLLYKTAKISFE